MELKKVASASCGYAPRSVGFCKDSDSVIVLPEGSENPTIISLADGSTSTFPLNFPGPKRIVHDPEGRTEILAFHGDSLVRASVSRNSIAKTRLELPGTEFNFDVPNVAILPNHTLMLSHLDFSYVLSMTGRLIHRIAAPMDEWTSVFSEADKTVPAMVAGSECTVCGLTDLKFWKCRNENIRRIGPSFSFLGEWLKFAFSPNLDLIATAAFSGDRPVVAVHAFPSFEVRSYWRGSWSKKWSKPKYRNILAMRSDFGRSLFFYLIGNGFVNCIQGTSKNSRKLRLGVSTEPTAIDCHPTKPLLAVAFECGTVEVWSYGSIAPVPVRTERARAKILRFIEGCRETKTLFPDEFTTHYAWPHTKWIR